MIFRSSFMTVFDGCCWVFRNFGFAKFKKCSIPLFIHASTSSVSLDAFRILHLVLNIVHTAHWDSQFSAMRLISTPGTKQIRTMRCLSTSWVDLFDRVTRTSTSIDYINLYPKRVINVLVFTLNKLQNIPCFGYPPCMNNIYIYNIYNTRKLYLLLACLLR